MSNHNGITWLTHWKIHFSYINAAGWQEVYDILHENLALLRYLKPYAIRFVG
ncbi:MAG: hypothetical protein JWR61_4575 [Ferruginibacter sp.]|nr:hypothetical protein [Ferruginibacter sp.]